MNRVEQTVRAINPTLRLYKTTKSQIDLKELFDLRAYSAIPTFASTLDDTDEANHDHDHTNCDEVGHDHSVHNSGIATVLVPLPRLSAEQYDRLNELLETLLWNGKLPPGVNITPNPEILRTKGLINLHDGREMVLQGVTDLFELKEAVRGKESGEKVEGKVVFIGRGVDDRLKDALLGFVIR